MQIQFLGATREVTGSCALVTAGGHRVLVDCGLVQGSYEHEAHNADDFNFDPAAIDAVILSHAHIDHSGRIPLLVKRGFTGPIYTHEATADLCRVMLADAGFLNERQADRANRSKRRKSAEPALPLYTVEDARISQAQFQGLSYNKAVEILPGLNLELVDAGHILGSSIVQLEHKSEGETRKVVFSGDLGHEGAPILRDPTRVTDADLVILESTYGDRQHRSWEETWDELGEVLGQAKANKGNILIPAFTVGRTQELLMLFRQYYDDWGLSDWQIFLDSPMAIEATQIYEKHWRLHDQESKELAQSGPLFDLPNLHISQTTDESMAINRISSGAIIIAGSGMCTGGRIRHHLEHNIARHGSHIVIVGFQAQGTTGRMLVDGAERIRLFGHEHRVHARVHTIGGLSAHADQQGLLNWYQHFKGTPPIVLVHGEEGAMEVLRVELTSRFNASVTLASFGEKISI